MADKSQGLSQDFVHLARVALSERGQDIQAFLHRVARKRRDVDPQLAQDIIALLREAPTRSSPLRRSVEAAIPVDTDSRFQLLRVEANPEMPHEPVYFGEVRQTLDRLVEERRRVTDLFEAGLQPTRTVLFTGPPGVGKTLAARWIARELGKPLLILDLSAVMSSYLGRTGANLRHVLDYAKALDCVLLLDELDTIAKRRDDAGEIGELKRLVTVLLQQLDDWPSTGLLIAATNHSELLDPAIWRRFEQPLDFPLPTKEGINVFIQSLLEGKIQKSIEWSKVLSIIFYGKSYSEIEREINLARRSAALKGINLEAQLPEILRMSTRSKDDQIQLAIDLVTFGFASQRKAHELTGVARDTIRSRSNHDIQVI